MVFWPSPRSQVITRDMLSRQEIQYNSCRGFKLECDGSECKIDARSVQDHAKGTQDLCKKLQDLAKGPGCQGRDDEGFGQRHIAVGRPRDTTSPGRAGTAAKITWF